MKSSIALNQTFRKRLSMQPEYRFEITNYDKDNLYPQKVEEIVISSPIANRATIALSEFLRGDGFEMNGDMVVNEDNETLNDILRYVSDDDSLYRGYALHYNVNILGGITDITHIPFKNVRYGLPDENGKHKDVKVSPNWAAGYQVKYEEFPLWDSGMDSDNGYVMYVTPKKDIYPLATCDPILDSCQADTETQLFELGKIQNGFLSATLVKHPGNTQEGDREDPNSDFNVFVDQMKQMKGAENGAAMSIIEVPLGYQGGDLIEQIPANNNDTLFDITMKNIAKRIMGNFGMPPLILGYQLDSGMFNQNQMRDSYLYYNIRTKSGRNSITDTFNKILTFWYSGAVDVGGIIEPDFDGNTTDNKGATDNEI